MSSDSGDRPPLGGGGTGPRPLRRLRKAGGAPTPATARDSSMDAAFPPADRAAAAPAHTSGVAADPSALPMEVVERGVSGGAAPSAERARSAPPTDGRTDAAPSASAPLPSSSGGGGARARPGAGDDGYWDEEDELVEELERGAGRARAASPTEETGAGAAEAAAPARSDAAPAEDAAADAAASDDDDEEEEDGDYSEYSDTESGSMQLDDLHAETARLLRGAWIFSFFSRDGEKVDGGLSLNLLPHTPHTNKNNEQPQQKPPAPTGWAKARPPRPPSPWTACWPG
jgi:hypothetical protein